MLKKWEKVCLRDIEGHKNGDKWRLEVSFRCGRRKPPAVFVFPSLVKAADVTPEEASIHKFFCPSVFMQSTTISISSPSTSAFMSPFFSSVVFSLPCLFSMSLRSLSLSLSNGGRMDEGTNPRGLLRSI